MYKVILPTLLSVICFFACSKPSEQVNRITVTIEPQRYFAEQLVDTFFQVTTLVPPGTSPETYDPSPQQMAQLAKSKAYFCIGYIGFENMWLDRLKKNNPGVVFFDNSQGILLEEGNCHAGEDHAKHAAIDPHTWISPKQAHRIVQNMCEALITMDAEHADSYQQHAGQLLQKIEETDQTISDLLSRSSQKAFIIYHPALTYFARDYGLKQYAIETDGKEPSPEQLKRLVDTAKKEQIKTVFIQQEFDCKNAEIVAREVGARLVVINPLSYHWNTEVIGIAKALADE
jgi:zinc transport system substrate-binding protein